MELKIKSPSFKRIFLLFLEFALFFTINSFDVLSQNISDSNLFILGEKSEQRNIILLNGEWDLLKNGKKDKIKIPSSFSGEKKIIIQKKFFIDENLLAEKSFKIFSYGINHRAEFFINDIYVGKHDGGYLPFSILIKENILQIGGENYLKIILDNTLDSYKTIPLHQQIGGWKNYGGVTRDIFIEAIPKIFIENIKIGTKEIQKSVAKMQLDVTVSSQLLSELGEVEKIQLNCEVISSKESSVLKFNTEIFELKPNIDFTKNISFEIKNPEIWNLDSANLYLLKIKIINSNKEIIDESSYNFGVRIIETKKNKFLLNGKEISVNGVCWIENSKNNFETLSYDEMEKDIREIKNLGANSIRFAFHPPHPFMLELCSKYGLLSFIDLPFYEIPQNLIQSEILKLNIEEYLKESISNLSYNSTIAGISIGEGFQISNYSIGFLNHLNKIVKDNSDFYTYYTTRTTDSIIYKINSDLFFINPKVSTPDEFSNSLKKFRSDISDKPIFVGKIGYEAEPKNKNGFSDPLSVESQARFLNLRFPLIEKSKINGGFIWAYNDFEEDRPSIVTPNENKFLRSFGLVEINRNKKISYDAVRKIFLKEKLLSLEIGNYSVSIPVTYIVIGLLVLILITWYFNASRRFRDNLVRSFLRQYNFFIDIRDHQSLTLSQTTFLAMIISITIGIIFSTILFKQKSSFTIDYLLSSFMQNDAIKLFIIRAIENTWLGVFYLALSMFLLLFINSVITQIFAFFARKKITFFYAYSIIVWSAIPFIIFIPVGMVLYRVIETEFYFSLIQILIALFCIWIYFRTIQGFSIVYNIPYLKVFTLSLIIIIGIGIGTSIFINEKYAFFTYLDFYFSTIKPSL